MALNVSEAHAVNVLVLALTGRSNHLGEVPDLEARQAAAELLVRAAHRTLGAGLRPEEVEMTEPPVQVLHQRDPDSACAVTVYVGDQQVTGVRLVDVDPGAGMLRTDLEDRLAELADDTTPFGTAAREALTAARASSEVIDDRPEDVRLLAAAADAVRRAQPSAVTMHLETSDQNMYGFVLTDVRLADGGLLSDTDPAALEELADAVHDFLCDLNWDAAVGEDRHGHADVSLLAAP